MQQECYYYYYSLLLIVAVCFPITLVYSCLLSCTMTVSLKLHSAFLSPIFFGFAELHTVFLTRTLLAFTVFPPPPPFSVCLSVCLLPKRSDYVFKSTCTLLIRWARMAISAFYFERGTMSDRTDMVL